MAGTRSGEPGDGAPWDDLILVGVVARPHGIRGHLVVHPHTDFVDERFHAGARFQARLAGGEPFTMEIAAARIHQGRPVVAFTGIDSMTAAERYVGAELRIHPDEQQALPAGQYYHRELEGCTVVTAEGTMVGRVVKVESGAGQSRLVVAGAGRQHEIPLADALCTVDVAARRIVVRPPEGLLDL